MKKYYTLKTNTKHKKNFKSNSKSNSKSNTKLKTLKTLKGGKYLGSGAYGCVITPPLDCKKSKLTKKTFTKNANRNANANYKHTKYVSKIIKQGDSESYHEINISKEIKKFDPHHKYFITYESVCKIKNIPSNRNNTERIEYRDHSLKKYDVINNNGNVKSSGYNHNSNSTSNNNINSNTTYNSSYYSKKKSPSNSSKRIKTKCLVDTRLDPINIILPFGGYDLIDLKNNINDMTKEYKKSHSLQSKLFIKTYTLVTHNFKVYFKNLVMGLYKLHTARIVNCDIKLENIMANYNTKTKKVDMRFIDFGFSEHLTPDYCKNYNNIKLFGTIALLPPEMFIIEFLNKNYKKNSNSDSIYNKIHTNIKENIDDNVKSMFISLKEYDYNKMLYKPYKNNIPLIKDLYNDIFNNYENKTILHTYFGTHDIKTLNGYLQKADVYSLGCSMYEFLVLNYTIIDVKTNIKLHNLLKHMIHPDPRKRYNILECLKHPYFK